MDVVTLWRRFELADQEPANVVDEGEGDVDDGAKAEAEADVFQAQMFQQLADFLRNRVDVITNGASPLEQADERAQVETYVGWLERCVSATSQEAATDTAFEEMTGRGGRYFNSLGKRARYASNFFVKVICFAMDLRDDDYGKEGVVSRTFHRAIRLLPPQVQKLVEDMYTTKCFPSASTMSRANFYMDVTFMRLMAARHDALITARALLFALTDASPIGGKFYQITEYFALGGQDKGELLAAASVATSLLRSFPKRPEELEEGDLAVMERLMVTIRAAKKAPCVRANVYRFQKCATGS